MSDDHNDSGWRKRQIALDKKAENATDKPIKIKPTTWFGNPAKTAQWYTCPNCAKQSPLTLEWIGLTDDEIKEIVGPYGDAPIKGYTRKLFDQIEAKLRRKNEHRG